MSGFNLAHGCLLQLLNLRHNIHHLANLKRDQQQVEDKQQSLEKELADNKDRIVDDTSSEAEREELLRDNDRLRPELLRLAAKLRSLQYQAQSTQDEIDSRLAELQL